MEKYDLIVIGSGPAGLTAAIYAARYKMKVLVIGKTPGGYAGIAHDITNFPSHEKITGAQLMIKILNQAKNLGAEIKSEEVVDIKKLKDFDVTTRKDKYSGKKIIIATGTDKKKLGLERENELIGRGISYCATCDAALYKNKITAVTGGGDSAISTAILLGKFAKKVYIIYKGSKFEKANPTLYSELKKNKNIEIIFNSSIERLIGKDQIEDIEIIKKGKKETLKIDGLFIEIGSVPGIGLAKMLSVKTENNYIDVDKRQKTNIDGVYAAGDVTNNPLKQIITACAEGAIAANTAYAELRE